MPKLTKTTETEEQEKSSHGLSSFLQECKEKINEEPNQKICVNKEKTDSYHPPLSGLIFLQVLIFLFLTIFVSRFWFLQVHRGEVFAVQAQQNHWRQEHISAPRGRIVDVRGRKLADNCTAYGLSIVCDEVKDLPATLAQVSAWTGVPLEQIRERYRQGKVKIKPFEPLLLARDLSFEHVIRIESELHSWPGLEVIVLTKRRYPEKELFAHILGYVSEANETELAKDPSLSMGDLVGKSGIEYSLDKRLRGNKGLYNIEVDASGHMLNRELVREPRGGQDLKLSIDLDLQRVCWDALGNEVGSVVVLEPETGKLRALVSRPAYDNNLFADGITKKNWEELQKHPQFPLQNRAIQSTYPPGSVWKLLMSVCFMESGISPYETVYCRGSAKLGQQIFRCWKHSGHGRQNLEHSIMNSCDVYYYIMADRIGVDRFESFAKQCGFGKRTGIDLPHERTGLVPSKKWKKKRFKRAWGRGDNFNASIGQGYVLTTPLQIAVYVGAMLNGGRILKPALVDTDAPQITGYIPAHQSTLRFILEAMHKTASGGTARVIRRNDAIMGGKTGTAQVVRLRGRGQSHIWKERDHAWIATWGKKQDKTYVVIVMVEHGGGGSSTAGPIAKNIYNFLFSNPIYYEDHSFSTPPPENLSQQPLPPNKKYYDRRRYYRIYRRR